MRAGLTGWRVSRESDARLAHEIPGASAPQKLNDLKVCEQPSVLFHNLQRDNHGDRTGFHRRNVQACIKRSIPSVFKSMCAWFGMHAAGSLTVTDFSSTCPFALWDISAYSPHLLPRPSSSFLNKSGTRQGTSRAAGNDPLPTFSSRAAVRL